LLSALVAAQANVARTDDPKPPFDVFLDGVKQEALARGLREDTVARALDGLQPIEIVLERDRTQAEFTLKVDRYVASRVSPKIVRTARRQARTHAALLRRVGARYGVDPRVVVAIWGLESNFGRFSGVRPTVAVLATLAWDRRRAAFFRGELLSALSLLDRGDVEPERLRGSWAGAIGQAQFMPSSYLEYAVDFDGDGRRDIWRSVPDVFASIANYLEAHGWTTGERWGREVAITPRVAQRVLAGVPNRTGSCAALREMRGPLPLADWRALGVTQPNGRALPRAALDASLVTAGPRAYLVYRNYDALLEYNCAQAYALSVGVLADRLGK
jgi:membrane-bound lytic murein transglycosylase B